MKIQLLLCLLAFALCAKAQQPIDSRQQEIVFKNVTVLPMDTDGTSREGREGVLKNQTVVIKNGLITAMGRKIAYDKNALVINAKGKFLMPGLAEMHAHVPPIDDIEPMKEVLLLFAANGVTTIRGMLGHPRHLELRSKIQSGEILGPKLYTSGPSFSGVSVKTAEEGIEKVKSQKLAGYDFMKMHPGLSKVNFEAIIKTAKEVGMTYGGHVSFQVGVWRSAEVGYATIDHLDGMIETLIPRLDTLTEGEVGLFGLFAGHRADMSQMDKLLKTLRDNNVWIVPTQALAERWMSPHRPIETLRHLPEMKYMSKKDLDNWATAKGNMLKNARYDSASVRQYINKRKTMLLECQRQGVGLLLGSDAPQVFNVPGFSVHDELEYLVDAGLTPYQALRTGTFNVGKFFKQDNLGIVKMGAVADLVLLKENPLKNIKATRKIEGVMLNGRWLSKEAIEQILKKLVK